MLVNLVAFAPFYLTPPSCFKKWRIREIKKKSGLLYIVDLGLGNIRKRGEDEHCLEGTVIK